MKRLVLMVIVMLKASVNAQYSPYHRPGTVHHHHNSELFGMADPLELPSEPYQETYEPTYRTPVPPGHALNSDGYIIPTSHVVTNPRQQYGARSPAPVPIYETNNRPTVINPNYAMNNPPAGNPNIPMNNPPAGNPNFAMNRPSAGSPNFAMNIPPTGNPNFAMNNPPAGNPNFAMNRPPADSPNYGMNNPPAGNPNFAMNNPPAGNPNFVMNGSPTGNPNFALNNPPAGNGMNNPNYAMNNRPLYANRRNVANITPFQVGGNSYNGRTPPGSMSHRAPNNVQNNQPPKMNPSFAARNPYYGAGNPRNYGADISLTSMNFKNINTPNNEGLPQANYNLPPNFGSNPIPYEAMMPQKPPGYSANNPFKYGDRRRGSSFIPSPPIMKSPTAIWG
ncbi:circumsporozoite protein-like [Patella vulgata]|uniref:circumsporozoite protein-like n=1 Tax=Patella vulgata TaxID=6465 RepID=UPI0024A9DC16|nr:circumsporozoite protein-like [Patella vulgata]